MVGADGADAARWDRLERYARWRRRRGALRLTALPCDVLHHLATHYLDGAAVRALAHAFVGFDPDCRTVAEAALVPEWFRSKWIYHELLAHFEATLRSFADPCLFHALGCARVVVHADWSPFARKDARPACLAEYAWDRAGAARRWWRRGGPVRAHVRIHEQALSACLLRALQAKLPQLLLTCYRVTDLVQMSFVTPWPVHSAAYQALPLHLLAHTP